MEKVIFGYIRISTKDQSLERQERNILKEYPSAKILKEVFTGTKVEGRKEFNKLLKNVRRLRIEKKDVTIVFDSVSRMSRNSEEGFKLYEELYNEGVNLIFLKEPSINTSKYREAMEKAFPMTGDIIDHILEGINKYNMAMAKRDIEIVFEQAQKEVDDLRQRTVEGMETARMNGKQIGRKEGSKIKTKKSIEAKEKMKKYLFDPSCKLNNKEIMALVSIDKNTFYKYRKEIENEMKDLQKDLDDMKK